MSLTTKGFGLMHRNNQMNESRLESRANINKAVKEIIKFTRSNKKLSELDLIGTEKGVDYVSLSITNWGLFDEGKFYFSNPDIIKLEQLVDQVKVTHNVTIKITYSEGEGLIEMLVKNKKN